MVKWLYLKKLTKLYIMKNLKKHLVLGLLVLFVGTSINVHARQNTKTWTWKKHRLKFDLPLNWKINSNSRNKFGATGDKASLLFIPWHDGNVTTAKQVAMRAYQQSTMVSNKKIIGQQKMTTKGGLQKYMLLVEGTRYPKRQKNRKNTKSSNGYHGVY